jgi:hypothetical protein
MKKKIQICAITLLIALCSYGQPYEPVISTDSTSWDIAWKELFGNVMGSLYSVSNKDSIYNDLYFLGFYSNAEYVGKIREDVNTGKIWYTPPDYTDEYLIMDLSLTVGDTFDLPVYNTTIPIEVVDIYYINQRKCIEFDYQTEWDEPLRFIEGVGRNIAMCSFWFGEFTYVACKYNAGELAYVNSNPNFIGCELDPTGINTVHSNAVQVYPNPAGERLFVACDGLECHEMTVSIFNVNGMEVYRNIVNANETIDLTTFNKGLYLIQIFYNNHFKNIKLIKQ